jgi:4-amino-4-deoxy-L-arabinose transferase
VVHEKYIWVGLLLASLPAFIGILTFAYSRKEKPALLLLLASAFLLRLFMISLDPYLQDWDERFHALVAKNLIEYPFKPMLRIDPIMHYDYTSWCCNHIWVHKQPLFLWQMGFSMKLFGINEFALRLPSAIMGAIAVYFVHGIAKYWSKDIYMAFTAAIIACFSFYQLELITGRNSVDHNDVAFVFYVTASIWAFIRYLESNYSLKWTILVGVFVGCSVLTKWLTGFLIFGGWVLYLLLQPQIRTYIKYYAHIAFAFAIACIIFLPWQLYIANEFPLEYAAFHHHNWLHITEVLGGHEGNIFYHFNYMRTSYGLYLLPFLIMGLMYVLTNKNIPRQLTIAFLSMVLVVFLFFSVVVATKMPAFTYPVSSIIITLIAIGVVQALYMVKKFFEEGSYTRSFQIFLVLAWTGVMVYSMKPWNIIKHRSTSNTMRNVEINNAQIYKALPEDVSSKYVVLNCKSFEDTELMFYKDVNAFHWYPVERTLDSLQMLGYKFAAFDSHNDQQLPAYITNDSSILIIKEQLK